jgi:hypothetical protein
MLFTTGATQHTHIFYELPQAAEQLDMSETVLVRLSQYFKIPALAYEEEGYLSFKGELLFSEPDIRFFKMVKERLMSGATLPQVKQETEISARILPVAQPVLETTANMISMPESPVPLTAAIQPAAEVASTQIEKKIEIEETKLKQPFAPEKQPSLGMPKAFETNPYQTQPPKPAFQRQPLPSHAGHQGHTANPIQTAFPMPQVSNHHILKSMIYSQQHQNQPAPINRQPVNTNQHQPTTTDKAGYVSQPGNPASGFNRWHQSQEPAPATAHMTTPETSSLHQAQHVIQESFNAFGNTVGQPHGQPNNSLHQRFATPPQGNASQVQSGKQTPGLSYALREALAANQNA